jgi:3-oxoacyl-[acyl-carrier protein] reductase
MFINRFRSQSRRKRIEFDAIGGYRDGQGRFPPAKACSTPRLSFDAIIRAFSADLGSKQIRVSAVNPCTVETEGNTMAKDAEGEFRKYIEAHTPLGRIGQVDDIAPAVAFFASDDSKWITGETLYIAGGYR